MQSRPFCPNTTQLKDTDLLFGQVLLQHDVHIRPDLQLRVRRFPPCAKEHQQEQKTLMSTDPRDLTYYKHSKHKHSQLTLIFFFLQIKLTFTN